MTEPFKKLTAYTDETPVVASTGSIMNQPATVEEAAEYYLQVTELFKCEESNILNAFKSGYNYAQQPERHPEDYCHKCNRDNPRWYAPNEIFNKVTGSIGEGIICPICFLEMAKDKGLDLIFTVEHRSQPEPMGGKSLATIIHFESLLKSNQFDFSYKAGVRSVLAYLRQSHSPSPQSPSQHPHSENQDSGGEDASGR